MSKKDSIKALSVSMKSAHEVIAQLSPKEKEKLETFWDIEHTYYSSALEGSKLDRKEVEKIARSTS